MSLSAITLTASKADPSDVVVNSDVDSLNAQDFADKHGRLLTSQRRYCDLRQPYPVTLLAQHSPTS